MALTKGKLSPRHLAGDMTGKRTMSDDDSPPAPETQCLLLTEAGDILETESLNLIGLTCPGENDVITETSVQVVTETGSNVVVE